VESLNKVCDVDAKHYSTITTCLMESKLILGYIHGYCSIIGFMLHTIWWQWISLSWNFHDLL